MNVFSLVDFLKEILISNILRHSAALFSGNPGKCRQVCNFYNTLSAELLPAQKLMVLQPALAFEQLFNDKSGLLDFYNTALLIFEPRAVVLSFLVIYSCYMLFSSIQKSIDLPRNEEGAVEQA